MRYRNMMILYFSMLFIWLGSLSLGDDNSVSYYLSKGNDAFQVENYSEALKWYDLAIRAGYQPNAPIINRITANSPCYYHIHATEQNNDSNIFDVNGNPIDNGFSLYFQITNPNTMELKIDEVYVNLLKYFPIENVTLGDSVCSVSALTRGYSCDINTKEGLYICKKAFPEDSFIKIPHNELEWYKIDLNARSPGIYFLGICLNYSIGSEANEIFINDTYQKIGFFDMNSTREVS